MRGLPPSSRPRRPNESAGEIDPKLEDRMRKLTVIAVAAGITAMVGHAVTRSEHAPPPAADENLMPSPFKMMSDARDLQAMPFVAP
jgi:hypothetical protein